MEEMNLEVTSEFLVMASTLIYLKSKSLLPSDNEESEEICREEAEKLLATLDVPEGRQVEVPFWTKDFPELIAVGKFSRDKSGKVIYELDFSQSTL